MRIVAVSDLHGYLPDIPACDLLIVAGDVCADRDGRVLAMVAPDQQARWFDERVRPWLAAAPARHRVLIWGNHDWCGEHCDFSSDSPRAASSDRLVILNDERVDVEQVKVWGSPWSAWCGEWAFMASPQALAAAYAEIPAGIDILVSHQPPYGYGDLVPDFMSGRLEHAGSRELLTAIDRVRPRLVVCGHIHEGHGRYAHDGIPIVNASVVDSQYRLVHEATVVDIAWTDRRP